MTDLEQQLREVMDAAVADAEPRGDVMRLVRRRYRRRNMRMTAAVAVALAAIVAMVPLIGAVRGRPPSRPPAPHVRLFPGGGRILLRSHGDLRWLYPDGQTVTIASGYAGARLAGPKLLAWKDVNPPGACGFQPNSCSGPGGKFFPGVSYYTMNLDGRNARLVLPAERPGGNTAAYLTDVQPSPDGSMLAYLRVEQRRHGSGVVSELWTVNLATGRRINLGSYSVPAALISKSFVWEDNGALLVDSADARTIWLVNIRDGSKSTYLTLSDPLLTQAYEKARPGQGAPASISVDGWSPDGRPAAFAVSVAGSSANALPAEFLVNHHHVLAFAPGRNSILTITWGHDGVFFLHSGEGDSGSWNTYAGTTQGPHLYRAQAFGNAWDSALFSPKGNAIAFFYSNADIIGFVPLASPMCHQTGRCLRFRPKLLYGRGTPLFWAP
jgi:hypothetical protein